MYNFPKGMDAMVESNKIFTIRKDSILMRAYCGAMGHLELVILHMFAP